MERYLLMLLLIGINQPIFGQSNGVATTDDITHPVTIRTFDLEERIVIHQHFYNTEWKEAKIFKDDASKGFLAMIKYDILNQRINFLFQSVAMLSSSRKISSFTFLQSKQKFIGLIPPNWNVGKVFFESILEGKYGLLLYHEGVKQKPDYHPVLNTGSKSEKIIEKQTYYLLENEKVFKIPSRKKAATKFFKDYLKDVGYLKEHKVNFKKQADLIQLFHFMNEMD